MDLKQHIASKPMLLNPRRDGRFILDPDVSSTGISVVLSQMQEEHEHVIAYGSRCLSVTQRNYWTPRHNVS